ncbi:MAG: peptidylprolyl isomerase [Robiginitomaculum sp.]|nr:peptidylprolyl isomerase [Robiginitomaculum sp.]
MKISASKLLSSIALGIVAALSYSAPAFAQTAHGIAAVVNDDVITTYDLRQRSLFMMATQGIEPTDESKRQILAQAMRNLVDEKLQIQESKKYDQTISPEAVANGVQNIISRNGISVEEFSGRLAAAGISISTLQDQIRAEIAWQRIIGGLYGSRIRISDAQIDETLTRVSANADKPSYRVAEIYIEATPDIGGMNGAVQGAEAMIEQLGQGAPFQILARQFSSAPSAAKGGDIGWIREGELREEINAVLLQMEKGQISKPIPVPGGVYVVALADKKISTSETFYTLNQINYQIEDQSDLPAAKAALEKAAAAAKSCDTLAKDLKEFEGIGTSEMGEIRAGDLTEDILEVLAATNVGEVSTPMATGNSLISVMVCDRTVRGSGIPSRDEVENRLLSQQEAQASRRHLRNLRRKATIVSR